MGLQEFIADAWALYGEETDELRRFAVQRFDTAVFPTIGQYDWLSGRLLYCIVRHLRPIRIVEISTSSGYSTLFSGTALKANGQGVIHTFELDADVAGAAAANFIRFGVEAVVRLHIGDARQTVMDIEAERRAEAGIEVLFLDSEHTERFARFVLDALLPDAHPDSLFHMHDILPVGAQVRYVPYRKTLSMAYRVLRRFSPRLLRCVDRQWAAPFDVTSTSEAVFGQRLAARMPTSGQAFIHHLLPVYGFCDPQEFAGRNLRKYSADRQPMEWNDSWWAVCGPLRDAYAGLKAVCGRRD